MIELRNVTKKFGDTTALENISLSIPKGQVLGLLGVNGAGKTTLMRAITGYLQPTKGEIVVNDKKVQIGSIETKKQIGYLPEGNPLYKTMKAYEYLDFIAGLREVKNKHAEIKKVINQANLEEKVDELIENLSKGYKQRVGLAAALLGDPEIVILDEPSSGLDPYQAKRMKDVIKKLGQTRTVIFSTHILQEVEDVCDKIAVLKKGKLVAYDTTKNVLKEKKMETLEELFESMTKDGK